MKLKTLIIDDEPIAWKASSYASKVPFIELVGVCRSGIEATEFDIKRAGRRCVLLT